MTDQSIARRDIFAEAGNTGSLKTLFKNWQTRRRVKKLVDIEMYILDDIGVTRQEVIWASRLPFTVNSALALQDRSWRRRNNRFCN